MSWDEIQDAYRRQWRREHDAREDVRSAQAHADNAIRDLIDAKRKLAKVLREGRP